MTREEISARLTEAGYIADRDLSTALWLMEFLKRPLLLEGEAGVGKTEVAKALAAIHKAELIRLQCYEGLDQNAALYEWNYQRQLLAIKAREGDDADAIEEHIFSERYLLERPLLAAIRRLDPPVLLIDEVDRADEEFEAFLLELLAEATITIPEIGTVHATVPPIAVLTSNRTRDLHDALKRRCLYHWIDYPDLTRAAEIIRRHVPSAAEPLTTGVAAAVQRLRSLDLQKPPGVAEAIDWVGALSLLGLARLDEAAVSATLGSAVKYREDVDLVLARGCSWIASGD
jgi:MoxR-like ATPase